MQSRPIWPFLLAAVASGQTITNFAGNGLPGYEGDNLPAMQAKVTNVTGLAADAAGNIYLADQNNNVVRKVDTHGIITTFAGIAGAAGFSGDTGLASGAKLSGPTGVCVGPLGDVYVNDQGNNRVRKIAAATGVITTVAGNGTTISSGDTQQATSAGMVLPLRCAVDSSGNLYIVDQRANVIRKVNIVTGVITAFAGNYSAGFSGDNGAAVLAQLNGPTAVSFDALGNLYVTDQKNQRIRKIDTSGMITTVAGNGMATFAGDNGPATSASLNFPEETAIDSAGNLFIVDTSNQVIREVTPTGMISTVAGTPQGAGSGGDQGPPAAAQFKNPLALTLDPMGNLYVGDTGNNRVRKIVSLASGPLPCTYSLSSGGQAFPAAGGNGSVNITAGPGCQWTIPDLPIWIMITHSPPNGGNGTITYEVAPNPAGDRSVTLTGNGLSYIVEQEASSNSISGLRAIGSMAHLAAQENWTTTFTLVNKALVPATARLSFFGDALLDPTRNAPLTVPLTFPQQAGSSAPLLAATFDRTLNPTQSLVVTTPVALTSPLLVGSAQLASPQAVDGFAIFHHIPTGQEAVVPMETRKAASYLLAFDNTGGLVLGVAVENVTSQPALIPVIVRDQNGGLISTMRTSISLDASGHMQFVLSDPDKGFPETAGIRGTIEFDTPPNGQISVLGLRFTPPNNALTTIPALAQVGTGGGSIAHLAAGGDGWKTTFVLVNAGTTAASATLNFYADQTGVALPLPLSFPQTGDGGSTIPLATYITPTLAAGATWIVVSSGTAQLVTGSAQITSDGNVGGFVIFRHGNQEAVVPLESRNAQGYIIAFDNTNGTATGIAVNAVSPPDQTQTVNIPVTVRDETGKPIANETIALAPNGHYAFTLGIDKYQTVTNILNMRGTIEFDTPPGVAIGALGIRIPAGATTTYTTLPALARQ